MKHNPLLKMHFSIHLEVDISVSIPCSKTQGQARLQSFQTLLNITAILVDGDDSLLEGAESKGQGEDEQEKWPHPLVIVR